MPSVGGATNGELFRGGVWNKETPERGGTIGTLRAKFRMGLPNIRAIIKKKMCP